MPVFRRHTVLGVSMVALVSAGWVLGPGAAAYMHAYLAAALAASAVLLTVSIDRVTTALPLGAAACEAVDVAHNWMPLMAYVVAALVVALLPFRQGDRRPHHDAGARRCR